MKSGGGVGHWHIGGGMKSRSGNLPFAGIPPEMVGSTNALIKEEPDFSDIN